jgi:hypothetical protein
MCHSLVHQEQDFVELVNVKALMTLRKIFVKLVSGYWLDVTRCRFEFLSCL